MKVTLIASTSLDESVFSFLSEPSGDGEWVEDGDFLAEMAGRSCYESFDRPNPDRNTNQAYLAHILEVQHESVLVHAGATFFIQGVSRSLTHELVRHRFLVFSQKSQRYVDESKAGLAVPPVLLEDTNKDLKELLEEHHEECKKLYKHVFDILRERGYPKKPARGVARAFLAESTETRIVVSGNYRAWRDFLKQRLSKTADQEIRELAEVLLAELSKLAPNSFQDLTPEGD